MDDRVDIRPRLVDGRVDYPLLIRLGLRPREDVSFQIEFDFLSETPSGMLIQTMT